MSNLNLLLFQCPLSCTLSLQTICPVPKDGFECAACLGVLTVPLGIVASTDQINILSIPQSTSLGGGCFLTVAKHPSEGRGHVKNVKTNRQHSLFRGEQICHQLCWFRKTFWGNHSQILLSFYFQQFAVDYLWQMKGEKTGLGLPSKISQISELLFCGESGKRDFLSIVTGGKL